MPGVQFVLHAALDAVDEQQWSTTNMHLGVVDKFHNLQASIWLALSELHTFYNTYGFKSLDLGIPIICMGMMFVTIILIES